MVVLAAWFLLAGAAWTRFHRETLRLAKQDEAQRFERVSAQLVEIEKGYKATDAYSDASRPFAVGGFMAYRYAAMPPTALASLSVGQSDLYPSYAGVTIWSNKRQHWSNRRSFVRHSEIENPTNLLAGRFDVAFVLVYLYPLLILALSYNLLSAEKEQGTLQMLLAQPVGLKTFALGEVGARAIVILLSAICLSFIGVLSSDADLIAQDAAWRFALWAAALIIYGLFWFGLAVAVNAFGKSSATNATALAALWLRKKYVSIFFYASFAANFHFELPPRCDEWSSLWAGDHFAHGRGDRSWGTGCHRSHCDLDRSCHGSQPNHNDECRRHLSILAAATGGSRAARRNDRLQGRRSRPGATAGGDARDLEPAARSRPGD